MTEYPVASWFETRGNLLMVAHHEDLGPHPEEAPTGRANARPMTGSAPSRRMKPLNWKMLYRNGALTGLFALQTQDVIHEVIGFIGRDDEIWHAGVTGPEKHFQ